MSGFHQPDLLSFLPPTQITLTPILFSHMPLLLLSSSPLSIWQSPIHLSEPSVNVHSSLRSLALGSSQNVSLSLPSMTVQALSAPLPEYTSHGILMILLCLYPSLDCELLEAGTLKPQHHIWNLV